MTRCECGVITGEPCVWHGDIDLTVTVEWMPPCWRGSHAAAGNVGQWPANGAMRLRLFEDCFEELEPASDGWLRLTQEA